MFASGFLHSAHRSPVPVAICLLFRQLNNCAPLPTIAFAVEYKVELTVEFAVGFAVPFLVGPANNPAVVFLAGCVVLSRIDSAVGCWDCQLN